MPVQETSVAVHVGDVSMNVVLFVGWITSWLLILAGFRFCYLLLRQNGRILLRLEAIEDYLDRLAEAQESSHSGGNGNRPLSESRIKRDGLSQGTSAPELRLPLVEGGEVALSDFRGKRVLLVF